MEDHYRAIIKAVGEDPEREGLLRTPARAARAMEALTRGYQDNIESILGEAIFEENYEDMVIVKDIEFYSLCEHHLLPFFGRCHVGYLPDGKIIGISKIARLVDAISRRLQVQERMTVQIADALEQALRPRGIGVVAVARHLCMMARGVEKQDSEVVTSEMRGGFRRNRGTRMEFMELIGRSRQR